MKHNKTYQNDQVFTLILINLEVHQPLNCLSDDTFGRVRLPLCGFRPSIRMSGSIYGGASKHLLATFNEVVCPY